MMDYPEYLDWTVKGREWEDRWSYRTFEGYPSADAPESRIKEFIADAKEAEKAIQQDLIAQGETKEYAYKVSCQWPLVDDAPMDAIRSFIGYMHGLQEATFNGIIM